MAFPSSNWFRTIIRDTMVRTSGRLIDFDGDAWKVALFTNAITGTFNFDTDIGYGTAPWNANEVAAGAGYTTGGVQVLNPAVSVSSGVVVFTAGDAEWPSSTITARGALLYDNTPTTGNKAALVAVNFGAADLSSNNGMFAVRWSASGILRIG